MMHEYERDKEKAFSWGDEINEIDFTFYIFAICKSYNEIALI